MVPHCAPFRGCKRTRPATQARQAADCERDSFLTKSGCQWRMLPTDFPPWQTVYDHFSRWNKQGVW
ncbi:transposase, partial [Crenobacter oryzisoli]|uniref:transposase n=1 Tax=Crenobacter oryzisoli TaxID=3056844 RepID=UPI003F4917BF